MAFLAITAAFAAATAFLLLFGPKVPSQNRREIELSDSAYGKFLPIGRGRVRIAGDLVWGRKVRSKGKKQGKGGGGGGKTYEYFFDGIYAIADASAFGPAKGILRVWADANLIYDATGESELDVKEDVTLRFRLGDAEQDPDPMQTADEGVLAQGFPGTILVALENFPLELSGSSIPNISAEVDYEQAVGGSGTLPSRPVIVLPWVDDIDESYGFGFNINTRGIDILGDGPVDGYAHGMVSTLMALMDAYRAAGRGTEPVTILCTCNDADNNAFTPASVASASIVNGKNREYWIETTPDAFTASSIGSLVFPDPTFETNSRTNDVLETWQELERQLDEEATNWGGVFWISHTWRDVWGSVEIDGSPVTRQEYADEINTIASGMKASGIEVYCIDTGDFGLALYTVDDLPTNGWAPDRVASSGRVTTLHEGPVSWDDTLSVWGINQFILEGGTYDETWFNGSAGDPIGEAIILDLEYDPYDPTYGDSDDTANRMLSLLFAGGIGDGYVALKDIIREICVRLKLSEGTDFDVSAVTGGPWGWVLDKRTTGAAALKKLLPNFYTLVGTSDGKIVFKDRGEASIVTIPVGHFVLEKEDEPAWTVTQADGAELPSGAEVRHMDPVREYEDGGQEFHQASYPDPLLETTDPLNIDGDIVISSQEALNIAYAWSYIPWKERDAIKGKLPYWYMRLVSNDAVTIDFGAGKLLRARITKASWTVDGVVDFEAVFEEPGALTIAQLLSSPGSYTPVSRLAPIEATAMELLDINLLRDTDDLNQTGSNSYAGLTGAALPLEWGSGTLYRSDDTIDYNELFTSAESMTFGVTTTALETPPSPWRTHYGSFVEVQIAIGGEDLQSVPYASILAGANPAIAIKADGSHEVFQYMTVQDLGGGLYRLSDLVRGRRGTDTMVGNNAIGDKIIFPTTEGIRRFSTVPGLLGSERYFRAVSGGAQFESAEDAPFTVAGNDLKPYAPVLPNVVREVSDDLTITFQRRSRIGSGVVSGVWYAPLSEASESYEIVVKDGPAGTPVRTIASATESFTYTSAQQTADGFTLAETEITFEIYQLSAVVGRGYTQERTEEIG